MRILKKPGENTRREIHSTDIDKKGIFLFWELFRRKFWNYIKLNLLYVITSVVSLVIYWCVFANFVIPWVIEVLPQDAFKDMAVQAQTTVEIFKSSVYFFYSCLAALICVTIFGGGVCSAGYNYVLRNYVRQENAYIFSDYFSQTKKNFGQALVVSVIDKILLSIAFFSLAYYYADIVHNGTMLSIIAFGVLVFALLFYATMHTYMWTIMVTFNVTIKQLFKNSFMLTVGTAARSVVYMICLAVFLVIAVILFAYSPLVVASLFLVLLMSVINLAGHIFSYPVIKKYMIDNNNKKDEGKN